jgi:Lar family restriction alleviation protein
VSDTLKPCPFCGSDDAFVEMNDSISTSVVCNDCGARGPISYHDDKDYDIEHKLDLLPGEISARKNWNERIENDEQEVRNE